MAFAQLTWRESLRDIEATLGANAGKLYGMGLRTAVRRSTLADTEWSRDWHVWADVAALLIRRARKLYASEPLAVELDNTDYCLDSTTIERLRFIERRLNNQPRRVLGRKTPNEAYQDAVRRFAPS